MRGKHCFPPLSGRVVHPPAAHLVPAAPGAADDEPVIVLWVLAFPMRVNPIDGGDRVDKVCGHRVAPAKKNRIQTIPTKYTPVHTGIMCIRTSVRIKPVAPAKHAADLSCVTYSPSFRFAASYSVPRSAIICSFWSFLKMS
jgi:hypothetical protein